MATGEGSPRIVGAFLTGYDADRAGHRRRAAAWGWLADRVVRWA